MQIKNKLLFLILLLLFSFNLNLNADEFNITAKEIIIEKDTEILTGTGSVKAIDSEGKIVNADKIIYDKSNGILLAEGNKKLKKQNMIN